MSFRRGETVIEAGPANPAAPAKEDRAKEDRVEILPTG